MPILSPRMAAVQAILALVVLILLAPSLARAQNTSIYTYDTGANLQNSYDVNGRVTSMTYDSDTNETVIASEPSAGGNTTRYYYDEANTVDHTYTDPSDATSMTYDTSSHEVVTGDSNTITYTYDINDHAGPTVTDGDLINSTTYDFFDNETVIGTVDPLGQTTESYYDAADNVVHQFDPLGHVTSAFYDGYDGQLVVGAEIAGTPTLTVYDDTGNVLEQFTTPFDVTGGAYDATSNVFGVTEGDFPAKSFFDVFTEIDIGGIGGGLNPVPSASAELPTVSPAITWDSASNTFKVAVGPESGSLALIAPALAALGLIALVRRRRARAE